MTINRIKNGKRIIVKDYSKEVIIKDDATGKIIAKQAFKDHIVAVTMAKAL